MNLILFDDHSWENLLPLTYTRPIAELRMGILTIREKWEWRMNSRATVMTRPYLRELFPADPGEDNLLINGSLLPTGTFAETICSLKKGESLRKDDTLLALRTGAFDVNDFDPVDYLPGAKNITEQVHLVDYPWKLFAGNGQEIESDYSLITSGRDSESLDKNIRVIHPGRVFAEPGFRGWDFTINASNGPVYLGRDTEIMEGSVIRGPFALGDHSVIKMGARIYGPTTVGPHCKAGGEINNSILQGYSNKAHSGFLGNSVIGAWCNLGADTNNSNLKNNYAPVKIWNYPSGRFVDTGRQFCGLIMGDHSKCGINTMFNTGTVAGVSANIYGDGFPRNFIPSFSWGGAAGFTTYKLTKAFETMGRVMERRGIALSDSDKRMFEHIFRETEKYRSR